MMKCNYNGYNLVILLSFGAHQAILAELLQKSLQSRQPGWNKCFIFLKEDFKEMSIYYRDPKYILF